jgi:hypothetical protein
MSNINYYNTDPDGVFKLTDVDTCKQLFTINLICNLIVVIAVTIIAIFQVVKVILIAKKFFIAKHMPHSARCVDENIIVFGS